MSYTPTRKNEFSKYPNPLDNPPAFHQKLTDFGERPYWSPDGGRIAFVESNYGDICEIDMKTREIKNLTKGLGEHHSFLRVLFLPGGDYLLIGPKQFKDRHTSRHVESELWFMDKEAKSPPVPLGQGIFEGIGVSRTANRITYAVCGEQDPSLGDEDQYQVRVAELDFSGGAVPKLVNTRIIYRVRGFRPEPQDFRHNDTEVIMAEYYDPDGLVEHSHNFCTVKGIDVATGEIRLYMYEPNRHNEPEGLFYDEDYTCLESACDAGPGGRTVDLFKLKLDGSGLRARLTRMIERRPWRATNSNVSPDGKWLAFMINVEGSEAGYGMGLGLMDLEAWEKSLFGNEWSSPPSMRKMENPDHFYSATK